MPEEPDKCEFFKALKPTYAHFAIQRDADGLPIELGRGAMGTTYRAEDTVLHCAVALKVISHHASCVPALRFRFLREARAAAQLNHPNVARVSHYGEQDGECYYTMEMVEGETLEERVRREGPLDPLFVLEIARQVSEALMSAESAGIIHRDLKPSNLMLASPRTEQARNVAEPLVKVIDFGLAKALSETPDSTGPNETRGFLGTPSFASPEQYARREEDRIDHRADIYSLGATMWYALCGRAPFTGSTLGAIHAQQAQRLPLEQLSAKHVPPPVTNLLQSVLALDPAKRPQSARELREMIMQCKDRLRHRVVRLRHGRLAVVLLLILGLVGAALWWRLPQLLTEKGANSQPLTTDPAAHELYFMAMQLPDHTTSLAALLDVQRKRIALLGEAVARDPKFVSAYLALSEAHDTLFIYRTQTTDDERSADQRSLSENALQKARLLRPNSGEVHLASAQHFFSVIRDYKQARVEVELARPTLPNNAKLERLAGLIAGNEGNFDDAVRLLERSAQLDPRNADTLDSLLDTYRLLRRYDEYEITLSRILAILPPADAANYSFCLPAVLLERNADLNPLRQTLALQPASKRTIGWYMHTLAVNLCARNADAISKTLADSPYPNFPITRCIYPKGWYEALAAQLRGDAAGTRVAFLAAREETKKVVDADPIDPINLSMLAMIDAGLGNKEQALREGRRAVEIYPANKSAVGAAMVASNLAVVYAWTGESDLALTQLENLSQGLSGDNVPVRPTYGDLKLNPIWDPLRGDRRFQALVTRMAPAAPAVDPKVE